MSATYLSFAIIKLSNKISGVMDQSSRPTAAYRQTTNMKNEYVWLWHQCFTRQKDCTPTTTVPCRMRNNNSTLWVVLIISNNCIQLHSSYSKAYQPSPCLYFFCNVCNQYMMWQGMAAWVKCTILCGNNFQYLETADFCCASSHGQRQEK